VQVGDASSRVDHRKRRLFLVDRGDVRFDLRLFVGGKPVQLLVDIGETVVEVHADFIERIGVLVQRLLVVDRYAVTEHDGIGYLHHGRFQMQGKQHTVLLRLFDLLGVELTQGGHIHHRGIDDLALQQRKPLLHDGCLAVGGNELDLHVARLFDRGGILVRVEVLVAHVGDARLRPGFRPLLHHLVRVLLGELLHRNGRPAVGVAFAKYGIDRRTESHGEPCLQSLFGLVLGFFGVVRDVVSLFLQLLDRALQLGNGSADVGQLDDVGFGSLCERSELRQMIGNLLIVGEILGEVRDDAAHERDISRFSLDAGTLGVLLNDGEQGVCRQRRRFIGLCPDNLRGGHLSSFVFAEVPTRAQPDGLAYLAPVVSRAATQMAPL